jgi:Ca2+-binding RTX toxin-like protein
MTKTISFKTSAVAAAALALILLVGWQLARADSITSNFESPTYTVGNINGQDGWQKTGAYDVAVTSNTYGIASFGAQTLRISDAVTSGSFGDQTFSKPLVNEAGETVAENGGLSGGTRQNHFEAQFDLASASTSQQSGLSMSVSPDRGDGARMSYLRFEDQADGIHVFFDDVTDPSHVVNSDSFNETDIATLNRTAPHTIKFVMDFVDGPDNDVVKIYIDGTLKITGTSWEDYYRFDTESNPSAPSDTSRTVDSLLFREGGTAHPANSGAGFLVDNLSLLSGASAPSTVKVTIDKFVDGSMGTAGSANNSSFPMQSSWNAANLGSGSGTYALSTTGFNSPTPYEAVTSDMTSGASYATNEVTGGSVVGATCADGKPFALNGYSTGDSLAAAQAAALSSTSPSFTNITSNRYVIVWNRTCPQYVHVDIAKFVDGAHATAGNANSSTFPMQATYDITAQNLGHVAGSDPFSIGPTGNNTPTAYEARTLNFLTGGNYATFEHTDQSVVGASCSEGKPFALNGYSSGDTLAAAQAATMSSTSPAFTNLQGNKYVIVWNRTCAPVVVSTVPPANACDTPTVAPAGFTLRNGTSGNDTVTLAPNTMFVGKGGNDKVSGPDGNYIVCTGTGNDVITLGDGNSTIDAGNGNNDIMLGNGQGTVKALAGNDTVVAGDGARTIDLGNGNNKVTTGGGSQTITTGPGNDKIDAGAGTDTCNAGGGNNQKIGCEL